MCSVNILEFFILEFAKDYKLAMFKLSECQMTGR